MNSKAALGFLAVLAAFIVLIGWMKRRATEIDTQSAALQRKVVDLQSALTKATSQPEVDKGGGLAQAEKLELMRLRNEVTQLRASNQALVKLEAERTRLLAENEALRGRSANSQGFPNSQSVPRDQWSFQGYATPEAAFMSGMWSMKEGQVQTLLESFTPEERQRFDQQNAGKTEAEIAARFQKEFGRVTGVRVMAQKEIAPNEVVLDVYLEGLGGMKKYRMNQVGQEWKAGGPINQNPNVTARVSPNANGGENAEGYDPLAFYRKNPELMKRYFPHLFKEGEQAGPSQGAQAIADRYGLGSAAPAEQPAP